MADIHEIARDLAKGISLEDVAASHGVGTMWLRQITSSNAFKALSSQKVAVSPVVQAGYSFNPSEFIGA